MQIDRLPARPKLAQNTSASGAAASVVLAAKVNESIQIDAIHHTYNGGAPGTKAITIAYTENGTVKTVVIGVAHTVSVAARVELWGRIVGDPNTSITITGELLAANTNTLDVFYS